MSCCSLKHHLRKTPARFPANPSNLMQRQPPLYHGSLLATSGVSPHETAAQSIRQTSSGVGLGCSLMAAPAILSCHYGVPFSRGTGNATTLAANSRRNRTRKGFACWQAVVECQTGDDLLYCERSE